MRMVESAESAPTASSTRARARPSVLRTFAPPDSNRCTWRWLIPVCDDATIEAIDASLLLISLFWSTSPEEETSPSKNAKPLTKQISSGMLSRGSAPSDSAGACSVLICFPCERGSSHRMYAGLLSKPTTRNAATSSSARDCDWNEHPDKHQNLLCSIR